MKLTWFVAGVAGIGLLAGCESIPPGAERGPNGTIAYDVLIEASEPGARVEANGEIVGSTPLHLKVFGDTDGTFHDFGAFEYVIRALPLATNQFVQTRVFQTGRMFTPEDRIPQRIFFDMNQQAPVYPGSYGYAPAGPTYYPAPYYYGPPVYYGPRIYVGPRPYRYRHW